MTVSVDEREAPLVHAEGCGVTSDYMPVCAGRACNVNPVSNALRLAAFEAECEDTEMTVESTEGHDVVIVGCGWRFGYRATLQGWAKTSAEETGEPSPGTDELAEDSDEAEDDADERAEGEPETSL